MKTRKRTFGWVAGMILCSMAIWSSTRIFGQDNTYEIKPEIRLPENRSDAARAIDAYERVMERYMTLMERSFGQMDGSLGEVTRGLDAIDRRLTDLSIRLARIEKALGIEPIEAPTPVVPPADGANKGPGPHAPPQQAPQP